MVMTVSSAVRKCSSTWLSLDKYLSSPGLEKINRTLQPERFSMSATSVVPNLVLMETAIAPRCADAKNTSIHSGILGSHIPIRSSFLMPNFSS